MGDLQTYSTYRDQIQSGDQIGWKTFGLFAFGWMIRFWSRFWYGLKDPDNHTSIVKRALMDGKERIFIVESVGKGLQLRLLSERLLDFHGEVNWYKLKPLYDPLRPIIGECIGEAVDRIESEQVPYDFKGCLGNAWRRSPKDAGKFYCSEFAFMVHEEASARYYKLCGGKGPSGKIIRELLKANQILGGRAPLPADTPRLGFFKPKERIF